MHFEHLGWGLQITVVGMGLVFALLALLWGLLTLVLRLDRVPEQAPMAQALAAQPSAEAAPEPEAPSADIVAAISAALRCHLGAGQRGREGAMPDERVHWPGSLLHASRWVSAGRGRQTRNWQRRR